jgi:hypothetical protein
MPPDIIQTFIRLLEQLQLLAKIAFNSLQTKKDLILFLILL